MSGLTTVIFDSIETGQEFIEVMSSCNEVAQRIEMRIEMRNGKLVNARRSSGKFIFMADWEPVFIAPRGERINKMKVRELIAQLSKLPPDAKVAYVWDGEARSEVEYVWLARSGDVLLAYGDAVVYETENRPSSAPTSEDDRYWGTPEGRKD